MGGLGRRMPITMTAFFIGSLSVIGLPPTGGFISKWYLVTGTLQAGQTALLVVLLISTLLNAAYFLPIVYQAFFKSPPESEIEQRFQEAPWACVAPLVFTALVTLLLFFQPKLLMALASLTQD